MSKGMTVLCVKAWYGYFLGKFNSNSRDFEYNRNIHSIVNEKIFL